MNRHIETFHIDWNGISVEIRWEPNWLNLASIGCDTAHLEIERIASKARRQARRKCARH